jgi:hypothetical protein
MGMRARLAMKGEARRIWRAACTFEFFEHFERTSAHSTYPDIRNICEGHVADDPKSECAAIHQYPAFKNAFDTPDWGYREMVTKDQLAALLEDDSFALNVQMLVQAGEIQVLDPIIHVDNILSCFLSLVKLHLVLLAFHCFAFESSNTIVQVNTGVSRISLLQVGNHVHVPQFFEADTSTLSKIKIS